MPCYGPLPAWRSDTGDVTLAGSDSTNGDKTPFAVPCGTCLGCRTAKARNWAIRCQLEASEHEHTTFTTLTYTESFLPPTLSKRHLQLFFKRLRKSTATRFRFFASGEYGPRTLRPHYHALLFGYPPPTHRMVSPPAILIQSAWQWGFTHSVAASPATIAYTAGYVADKLQYPRDYKTRELVDPTTGEVYTYQPPFLQMSGGGKGKHGIGGNARQYTASWRDYAIHNGHPVPVPRYLHDAWKQHATPLQHEDLEYEKYKLERPKYNTEALYQEALQRLRQRQQQQQL